MPHFRRRPNRVEAVRWTRENTKEVTDWIVARIRCDRDLIRVDTLPEDDAPSLILWDTEAVEEGMFLVYDPAAPWELSFYNPKMFGETFAVDDGSDAMLVLLQSRRIDPEQMIFKDVPYESGPQFKVSEIGKIFGKSEHWVRWRYRDGHFQLDGKEVGTRRSESNVRKVGLRDVEEIAHGMAQQGKITPGRLIEILSLIYYYGLIHEVISE